jgi:ankyrin repeat protein
MYMATIAGDVASMRRLLDGDPSLVRGAWGYLTPLVFAVRHNQVEAARMLLDLGSDPVNSWSEDTLLDIARDRGHTEMLALLEATLRDKYGFHPSAAEVSSAIRDRDKAKALALIDATPELLHAIDMTGNQPIHWATMTRQPELIDELVARGASLEAERFDHARPIHLFHGDYSYRAWGNQWPVTGAQIIAHLRSRGAVCDMNTACHTGDIDRVRELLTSDPGSANRLSAYTTYYLGSGSPLQNAASAGHTEIVKLLLQHGADPNLREEQIAPHGRALYSAVYNGHYEIAKLLLEHGSHPNQPVESSADALSIALMHEESRKKEAAKDKSETESPSLVELLCSYGASRSVDILAHYGDVRTAAAVFHANPSLADSSDAFSSAASNGHVAFVRLMLRYKPDLAQRVGCAGKTRELTELLFAHGMNASFPDWLMVTPLHRFAQRGDITNAELFLDHGADLEARDEVLGSRPIAWAAKSGKAHMVRFLLQRGAALETPSDPPWSTPLAWAKRRDRTEVIQLLEQFRSTRALPAISIAPYESLARDLVAAHNSGDRAALERLTAAFKPPVPLTQEMLRTRARQRLGRPPDSSEPITEEHAKLFIAKNLGFDSWQDLARSYES